MYTVTRQHQFPGGKLVVEVSKGNREFANPDALIAKYPGEFEEFLDPREAVETAIAIARAWRKDTDKPVHLGIGATAGSTMPFDTISFHGARQWAEETYLAAPKCDNCGELLPDKKREKFITDFGEFCSRYCAEKAAFESSIENYYRQN